MVGFEQDLRPGNPAIPDRDAPVGAPRHRGAVGRDEDRSARPARLVEPVEHPPFGLGVDLGGRLVADQHVRHGRERDGKPGAGGLSSRQVRRVCVDPRGEAEAFQKLWHAAGTSPAGELNMQLYIAADGQVLE
jgi:hypothetical protein